MRHAMGRSVGRVELKTKGGEREDLPLGIKGRGVSGAGPTWITWRQRLIRGTETIIQERVEIFSLFYLFFCPGVKFSPSCCFNRRHTEQHELPSCLFSISGVTNCLGKKNKQKHLLSALFTSHILSAVSLKFHGCVPAATWCTRAVTQEVNNQSRLVSSSAPSYFHLVFSVDQSQLTFGCTNRSLQ